MALKRTLRKLPITISKKPVKLKRVAKRDFVLHGGDMNGLSDWLSSTWTKLSDKADTAIDASVQKLINQNADKALSLAQTTIDKYATQNPDAVAKAQSNITALASDTFRKFVADNKWYFIGGGVTLLAGIGAIVYFSRKK